MRGPVRKQVSLWKAACQAAALVLVAAGAAAFAVLFRTAINVVFTNLFHSHDVLRAFRSLPWQWRLLLPAARGALAGVMSLLASRFKGGRGVGDVMEAVVLGGRHISLRLASSKALELVLPVIIATPIATAHRIGSVPRAALDAQIRVHRAVPEIGLHPSSEVLPQVLRKLLAHCRLVARRMRALNHGSHDEDSYRLVCDTTEDRMRLRSCQAAPSLSEAPP